MSRLTAEEHKTIAKVLSFVEVFYSRVFDSCKLSKTKKQTVLKNELKILKCVTELKNLLDDEFFVHNPSSKIGDTPYYGFFNTEEWYNKGLSAWKIGEMK